MRLRLMALVGALMIVLSGCGGSVDADAMEQSFVAASGGPVKSMCDAAMTHWSCFYDGVESGSGYLVVELSTPARMNAGALAKTAGMHWFNFIHCQFPDLKMIVVRVNGVDHNVARSSTSADRLSC